MRVSKSTITILVASLNDGTGKYEADFANGCSLVLTDGWRVLFGGADVTAGEMVAYLQGVLIGMKTKNRK